MDCTDTKERIPRDGVRLLADRRLTDPSSSALETAMPRTTAGDLRDRGLGLVPSGRAPHYDTSVGSVSGRTFGSVQITAPTADHLGDRFISATYTLVDNRHYRPDTD